MTDSALITWSVLMPVKVLTQAKSRLAELAGPRRGELALALAGDTVTAVLSCDQAARAVVITDDPVAASALRELGAVIVPDGPRDGSVASGGRLGQPGRLRRRAQTPPYDGLNAALEHGAAVAAARWPADGTAALTADLPALHPGELSRALNAAAAWPNAFVADAPGDGTTLYTAAPGTPFRPAFGLASRARHAAAGAAELVLNDIPGLRRDVDTPADLRRAVALGLGPRTAPLAAELLRCAPRGR